MLRVWVHTHIYINSGFCIHVFASRSIYIRNFIRVYSLRLKKTDVFDFDKLYLIARLQNFCVNSKINKSLLKYL